MHILHIWGYMEALASKGGLEGLMASALPSSACKNLWEQRGSLTAA